MMNKRTTMTYAVAAATAVTLLLSGCNGGDKDPTGTPTATGSSTKSASPSGTPSSTNTASPTTSPNASATGSVAIPEGARANTEDGAVAFVRFWFEQVNVAFTSPNPNLIPALSAEGCKSCANLATNPTEFAAKGQRAQPGPFKPLTNVRSLGKDPLGQYRVQFKLSQNNVNILDKSGKIVDTTPAESADRVALVSRKGEQWVMEGLAAPQS